MITYRAGRWTGPGGGTGLAGNLKARREMGSELGKARACFLLWKLVLSCRSETYFYEAK